jgi:hypothetical protein
MPKSEAGTEIAICIQTEESQGEKAWGVSRENVHPNGVTDHIGSLVVVVVVFVVRIDSWMDPPPTVPLGEVHVLIR